MSDLIVSNELDIQSKIFTIRGMQVMFDVDLAEFYGVETKNLNRAVKRNIDRFPENFRFQLTQDEYDVFLRFQNGTSSLHGGNSLRYQNGTLENQRGKHRKYLPYVFTEQGVSMLSAVLRSKTAIEISIKIIDSFVNMRKYISGNPLIFQRLDRLEQKQFQTDTKLDKVLDAIEDKSIKPKQGIFYDGQVFDAYAFVVDLIKGAKKSIILIDNYVDESVLTLFSKNQSIDITIYTKNITKQLKLDLEKYNAQYRPVTLKPFRESHDRFMIIDEHEVYHFGASLKDLGKKWFAFSKFDVGALEMLGRLK